VNNENRKDYSISEVSVLLGYRTASLGKWLGRFETTYWSHFKGGIAQEEFVVNTVGCQLPSDAVSCSGNLRAYLEECEKINAIVILAFGQS
jgi:hypothetical protein